MYSPFSGASVRFRCLASATNSGSFIVASTLSASCGERPVRTPSCWCSPCGSDLVFDVPHQPLGAHLGAVDVALGVRGHAFRCAGAGRLVDRVRDERRHLAGLGAADADAALPAVVILRNGLRFGIRDIDHVVLVDEDAARAAELRPLGDELAVLVEYLDAVVRAVPDEQPALGIHRDRVRAIELARPRSLLAPGLDELAIFGELHDARIGVAAMAVCNEDVAV